MKVIMGADPKGFALKNAVKEALIERGHAVFDATPDEPINFKDAAIAVAKGVQQKQYERGLVFCGSGMGVNIVANKFRGVYCALCESVYTARRAKVINNTNVLAMGGMVMGPEMGVEAALAWLDANHTDGLAPERAEKAKAEFAALVEIETLQFK